MSVTLTIIINHCGECPNCKSERYYTGDSFEKVYEWKCKSNHDTRIALMEWNDPYPAIPDWCPLEKQDSEVKK